MLHGDWSGAQEQLEQALDIVSTYGERIYLPQLLLTRGRHRAGTRPARQRRRVDSPCDHEARAQGALWLELLALTELCEHSTATVDDHGALGALVAQLSEGIDAPALARARVLLERAHSN